MASLTLHATSVTTESGSWSDQANVSVTNETDFLSGSISYYNDAICRINFPTCLGTIPAGSTINSVTFRNRYKVNSTGGTGAKLGISPSYNGILRGTITTITGNNISAVSSPLAEIVNNTATFTLAELLSETQFPQIYISYHVSVISGKTVYVNDAHMIVDYTPPEEEPVEGGSTVSVVVSGSGVGQAIKSGSSYARTIISASATGLKIISGSSMSPIIISVISSGSKIISGGGYVSVIISVEGAGVQTRDVIIFVSVQGAGQAIKKSGSSYARTFISASATGLSIRKGSSNSVVIIRAFGGGTISYAMMLTAVASYIKRDTSVEVICRTRNIRSARVRVNSEAINVTYKQNKATVIERDTKAEVKN